jgi:hypothetical protein
VRTGSATQRYVEARIWSSARPGLGLLRTQAGRLETRFLLNEYRRTVVIDAPWETGRDIRTHGIRVRMGASLAFSGFTGFANLTVGYPDWWKREYLMCLINHATGERTMEHKLAASVASLNAAPIELRLEDHIWRSDGRPRPFDADWMAKASLVVVQLEWLGIVEKSATTENVTLSDPGPNDR